MGALSHPPETLREMLRWQVEAGADEAISDHPQNRYNQPAASEYAVPVLKPAAMPRGSAPSPRRPAAYGQDLPGFAAAVPPREIASASANALAAAASNLDELRATVGRFDECALKRTATNTVFADGNPKAPLMFVGEAPGADEDIQGIPFVGRAGQLLTKIIEAIDLKREDVYIANVIKCRPPQNRNPEPDEVETCEPFLFAQIATIQPKVIVALGKFAAQTLLRTLDPISRLRGRVYDYRGARLIPTFHPAYLLRNPSSKRDVWDDMKRVRRILNGEE